MDNGLLWLAKLSRFKYIRHLVAKMAERFVSLLKFNITKKCSLLIWWQNETFKACHTCMIVCRCLIRTCGKKRTGNCVVTKQIIPDGYKRKWRKNYLSITDKETNDIIIAFYLNMHFIIKTYIFYSCSIYTVILPSYLMKYKQVL
jgi:hypothetical protein